MLLLRVGDTLTHYVDFFQVYYMKTFQGHIGIFKDGNYVVFVFTFSDKLLLICNLVNHQ